MRARVCVRAREGCGCVRARARACARVWGCTLVRVPRTARAFTTPPVPVSIQKSARATSARPRPPKQRKVGVYGLAGAARAHVSMHAHVPLQCSGALQSRAGTPRGSPRPCLRVMVRPACTGVLSWLIARDSDPRLGLGSKQVTRMVIQSAELDAGHGESSVTRRRATAHVRRPIICAVMRGERLSTALAAHARGGNP